MNTGIEYSGTTLRELGVVIGSMAIGTVILAAAIGLTIRGSVIFKDSSGLIVMLGVMIPAAAVTVCTGAWIHYLKFKSYNQVLLDSTRCQKETVIRLAEIHREERSEELGGISQQEGGSGPGLQKPETK